MLAPKEFYVAEELWSSTMTVLTRQSDLPEQDPNFYASGGDLRPFKWWPSPSAERQPLWHVPRLCFEGTEHLGTL